MPAALNGIRVLDLSRILAGPYCSMVLGDYGAEIIKVERPGTGDDTRAWGPPFAGSESAYFLCINRNKKSVTLDMQKPKGLVILKRLAEKCDVLIENFSPGVTTKLGIDYGAMRAINPRLVYCTITGFGPDGPSAHKSGYDLLLSAYGGLMGITGEEGGGPVKVGVAITDVLTGVSAVGAILAALHARERTGCGQKIDLSLLETQVAALINIASSYLISGKMPRRWGAAHESIVPYQAFRTNDRYIIIAVGNDRMWQSLCRALGFGDLAACEKYSTNPLRVKNRAELVETLQARIGKMFSKDVIEKLDAASVPCGPINDMKEVFEDQQVLHRKMLVEVDHPGAGRIKLVGIPVKFSETKAEVRMPPPCLGQHTEKVLMQYLDYSAAEIESLRKEGVI